MSGEFVRARIETCIIARILDGLRLRPSGFGAAPAVFFADRFGRA
jgi:hypothetical protein